MTRFALAATLVAVLSAAAAAQVPPAPPGMPTDPYARPRDMDPNEIAIDSANEQLRRGILEAEQRKIAKAARESGRARPAKAEDLVPGAAVADMKGIPVGSIELVEADGVVVATAAGKVKIPAEAFGKNRSGLLIGIGKDEFDALVAQTTATPAG